MNDILEELYLGNLRPSDQINPQNEEYREVRTKRSRKINDLLEEFRESNPTRKQEFVEILDMEGDEDYYEIIEGFSIGFRLGAKMILAIFNDE